MRRIVAFAVAAMALLAPSTAGAVSEAALSIQMSDTPDPVAVGGDVTYTLVIHNSGPSSATNPTVFDRRPPGMAVKGTTQPMGWNTNSGTDVTDFFTSSLAVDETAVFTILAGPAPSGAFTNTANVQSQTLDFDLTNNTASATTNAPLPTPAMALAPTTTATSPKKCKKRHRSAAAAKKRCRKKR